MTAIRDRTTEQDSKLSAPRLLYIVYSVRKNCPSRHLKKLPFVSLR